MLKTHYMLLDIPDKCDKIGSIGEQERYTRGSLLSIPLRTPTGTQTALRQLVEVAW